MATTLEDIVARARMEIMDTARPFQASLLGDSQTRRFEVPYELVEPATLIVYKREVENPTNLSTVPSGDFVLNDRWGVITFDESAIPLEGEEVVTVGDHYQLFAQTDMLVWAQTSFDMHQASHLPPYELADVVPIEELIIALWTAMEAYWALLSNAAWDIDITSPEGVVIPRSQRYQQLLSMIQALEERYDELAEETSFGIGRLEVLNLRRVSLRTGRLVPLYVPQEFDDQATPQRIYPPIDPGM